MKLSISTDGTVRALYTEDIDLATMGTATIARASHVEPHPDRPGEWYADLAPVDGPRLGPFPSRSAALAAEVETLEARWI